MFLVADKFIEGRHVRAFHLNELIELNLELRVELLEDLIALSGRCSVAGSHSPEQCAQLVVQLDGKVERILICPQLGLVDRVLNGREPGIDTFGLRG